ncbi:MAG: molybdenum cofactor biosynthesis protein MoaE [Anaerolineales bacterium]|nr:molybdenum cofactor biosynthesis protein MoaE [Anaerolineales bacterium]
MAGKAAIGLGVNIKPYMHITILFFAAYKDQAKTQRADMEIPANCTVIQLLNEILIKEFPHLTIHAPSTLVSINREFASFEDNIPEGAEVAIFPPVSGGEIDFPTIILLTSNKIELEELIQKITLPTTGACAIFTGMVREITKIPDYKKIKHLEYEAYQPMAEAKMKQVAKEIRLNWPKVVGIAIVQRIGKLEPQIPSTLIACTSAHRNDGIFEAAHFGINRLKEIVPVWKKEVDESGEEWIEGDYKPTPHID